MDRRSGVWLHNSAHSEAAKNNLLQNNCKTSQNKVYGRDELLARLEQLAADALSAGGGADPREGPAPRRLMVGLVGYPNGAPGDCFSFFAEAIVSPPKKHAPNASIPSPKTAAVGKSSAIDAYLKHAP